MFYGRFSGATAKQIARNLVNHRDVSRVARLAGWCLLFQTVRLASDFYTNAGNRWENEEEEEEEEEEQ